MTEMVHIPAVRRQAAGMRECLAAGCAGVGAVAGMGAHVCRQATGRGEGTPAGLRLGFPKILLLQASELQ